jgi:hypothetical protein
LLNFLFNTGFAVLDAKSGIHQTTLGIWASPGDTKNILVLDVEGTAEWVREKPSLLTWASRNGQQRARRREHSL